MKSLIRILSFFAKEINSVRRQPLLIGGLILGPFLILTMFGVGYTGERPKLRTALVVPAGLQDDPQIKQLQEHMGPTFQISGVYDNEEAAMEDLRQGNVDIVEVFPADITSVYSTGNALNVRFTYNQIDPLTRDWIEYLAYAQINELNKGMLGMTIGDSQERMGTLQVYLDDARTQIATIRERISSGERDKARVLITNLKQGADFQLLAILLVSDGNPENEQSQETLQLIKQNLDELEASLTDGGEIAQQEQHLTEIDTQLSELQAIAERVRTIDPGVIVSPLRSQTNNLVPKAALGGDDASVGYVRFYTPAVVALLLQHMMVTLAALSLIRESMLGTVEMFRVSPLNAIQVLIGKYLGYTLFALIIMAVLTPLLVFGLGIPFPKDQLWNFVAMTSIIITASLGWGFVISAVVRSDLQAVQFSMLMLLISVFFSGFFIPLNSFLAGIRLFARILPVTHGLESYQRMLLLNEAPSMVTYIWLGGITLVSFVLSWLIFRRQFQRR